MVDRVQPIVLGRGLGRSSHTGSNVMPLFLMHLGFEVFFMHFGLGFCRRERESIFKDAINLIKRIRITLPAAAGTFEKNIGKLR